MEPTRPRADDPKMVEEGWAPKLVPKSGPKFLALGEEEQGELRRLHRNLGHPGPEKFCRFLPERGAKPEVVEGAKDICAVTHVLKINHVLNWHDLERFTPTRFF